MIDRNKKAQLYERILGLKHKLRVNESGPTPQNHKEMATITITNWELEDEIHAIEEFLGKARTANQKRKLDQLLADLGDPADLGPNDQGSASEAAKPAKKAPSKKS